MWPDWRWWHDVTGRPASLALVAPPYRGSENISEKLSANFTSIWLSWMDFLSGPNIAFDLSHYLSSWGVFAFYVVTVVAKVAGSILDTELYTTLTIIILTNNKQNNKKCSQRHLSSGGKFCKNFLRYWLPGWPGGGGGGGGGGKVSVTLVIWVLTVQHSSPSNTQSTQCPTNTQSSNRHFQGRHTNTLILSHLDLF